MIFNSMHKESAGGRLHHPASVAQTKPPPDTVNKAPGYDSNHLQGQVAFPSCHQLIFTTTARVLNSYIFTCVNQCMPLLSRWSQMFSNTQPITNLSLQIFLPHSLED